MHLLKSNATKIPIADGTVDLIITHPPYLGASTSRYGGEESDKINYSQNKKKILKTLLAATKEMGRVLKPSGSIWIANGPTDMLDIEYVSLVHKKTDLQYIGKVVQNSHGLDDDPINQYRIGSENITTWYHFSKTQDIYFNPYEVKKYNNPVWNLKFDNISDPIDKALEINHFVADTMNSEIPNRLIKMFSKKGQIILDPFGGSALVAVEAAKLGRKGISGDISNDMIKAAIDRCILSGIEYTVKDD